MSIRSISALLSAAFLLGVACLDAQQTADTLTWHNYNSRTGLNAAETTLTPANVNTNTFGRTLFIPTDGAVDGQPLYVGGLNIGGATHNVVFIVTEHDTVYAADAASGTVLWKKSLLETGESPSGILGCTISPEIGITATPVIDLAKGPHGTIYVVNMAVDSGGYYSQRLNALDITTGAPLFESPTPIGAWSALTPIGFDAGLYVERAALLEFRGKIYTAWSSHCDDGPYNGWIIGYDTITMKQTSVLNLTPNGQKGAIWMSGAGMAATNTQMFLIDANGTFDTTLDGKGFPANQNFGNAFIELQLGTGDQVDQPHVADYYATPNTVAQSNADTDFGSGGVLLLPDVYDNSGHLWQLAVGAGKDTNIYVVDRNAMGHYNPAGGNIYQTLVGALPYGEWGAPAFFDNKVYYGGVSDYLKAFPISNARLSATPASRSVNQFGYPGTSPVISSNGTANGIVWAISHPAVLYAYNAENLSQELYNSNQAGTRDQFGSVDSFTSPLVANGRVYVPTQKGVAVFGLLK
jgi:hypothetical protein